MYEHVLVTGGAGFVGSSLAIALRAALPRARITALDNLHRRGSELNLDRLAAAGVAFVRGDVRSPDDLAAVEPPGLILECSAEPSVQAGYDGSPGYLIETNLLGCFHCLELARRVRADFLLLSTSRVYPFGLINSLAYAEEETRFSLAARQTLPGASDQGISEIFPLDGPRSLYGTSKLAAELLVEEYADAYGIRYIINRCGLIAGPWQMARSDQGVVALWMAAHYFDRELRYIGFGGSGKQVRDVLAIDDCCDLIVDQVRHFPLYANRRYNAGGGAASSLSLLETTALCRQISGNRIPISASREDRRADVRLYVTDNRSVSAVNGWRPRRDPPGILRDIYEWLRAEEARVKPVLLPQLGAPAAEVTASTR